MDRLPKAVLIKGAGVNGSRSETFHTVNPLEAMKGCGGPAIKSDDTRQNVV